MISLICWVAAAIVALIWLIGAGIGSLNLLALILLLISTGLAFWAAGVGPPVRRA